ncbi:metal/formaldehyde-sensitive transcriptional repressor [Marinagarivorans cellulosilyticus]|uniref:FrmR/RcnR family transcriptional regulator, repressor of frmRAB operon n=1 Tax=Marinagarivorans cellulosilyticus TaxID=2721545 RepID=A0AAN1WLG7_9GAMM|nr:metal/formaldehyde-sensitive transcriptional repressor [Marinagarivorans cellulosilyticus]BCD99774.1 FrmR/RcnR family transcriptional regulator, repressor of frmRAB operon [Marinagarivorans cellulosilyticus]
MAHIEHNQKKLLNRVRRIKGQANALEIALEDGSDCLGVLQQIAAIRGAVNGLMSEMLESHIREHLGPTEMTTEQRGQEVDDVVKILKSYLK